MKAIQQNILVGIIILSLLLINGMIYFGLISIFYKLDFNIIIGILGFWGAILSGLVAYLVASYQIHAQNKKSVEKEIVDSRSYIIQEEFLAPIRLEGIKTHENSKILSNNFYIKALDQSNNQQFNGNFNIPFYKFHHSGNAAIILDCHINIDLTGESAQGMYENYHLSSHLSVLEKGVEIYVPLINLEYENILVEKMSIQYKTVKEEYILYKLDLQEMKETHEVISFNSENEIINKEMLHEISLNGVNWIYPNKFKK